MKRALLIALTLVISVAFVGAVFAQAPAPAPEKKAAAPEKAKDTKKEETGPQAPAKADKKPAPKADKGGVKEESGAAKK